MELALYEWASGRNGKTEFKAGGKWRVCCEEVMVIGEHLFGMIVPHGRDSIGSIYANLTFSYII